MASVEMYIPFDLRDRLTNQIATIDLMIKDAVVAERERCTKIFREDTEMLLRKVIEKTTIAERERCAGVAEKFYCLQGEDLAEEIRKNNEPCPSELCYTSLVVRKEVKRVDMDTRDLARRIDRELDRLHHKMDTILRAIIIDTEIDQKTEKIMSAMSDAVTELSTQVEANTSAEQSAAELISKLAVLITENAGDPLAVKDLATKLKNSADALAAAVVANTPASP